MPPPLSPGDLFASTPALAARILGTVMLAAAKADAEGAQPGEARFLASFDDIQPGLVLGLSSDLARHLVLAERPAYPQDRLLWLLARLNAHAVALEVRGFHPSLLQDPLGLAHWEAIADLPTPREPYASWLFTDAPHALNAHPYVKHSASLGRTAARHLYPAAIEVMRRASPTFYKLALPYLTLDQN